MAILGWIFLTGILMGITSLLHGFILKVLWGWFIAPTFNLPELSIALAIGIGLIASLLISRPDFQKKEESYGRQLSMRFSGSISGAILALFFAWIVHFFL